MSLKKIIISGTGCALADFLYNGISFDEPSFKRFFSKRPGDGGLNPGKLVFTEELEKFSGLPYSTILEEVTGSRKPDAFNVGGPSLVSLIHASQMLREDEYEVRFFGMAGRDETSHKIFEIIKKTSLGIQNYLTKTNKPTPFTDVFSDPGYAEGQGERTFVNNIGAAWDYSPDYLNEDFFRSEIVCFGGTALVPRLHENLTHLLKTAKKNNCITQVNTVFDFINEKKDPGKAWPLGNSMESFPLIDILIMDRDEALRISGQDKIQEAASYFITAGAPSFIITNGANDLYFMSNGNFFRKVGLTCLPVSEKVIEDIRSKPQLKGDTTGCGDNFAGGVLSSVAWQLRSKSAGQIDIIEAISWGVASGGFTCFRIGGTFLEKFSGEKRELVSEFQRKYLKQIGYEMKAISREKIVIFGAGKIGRSFIGQLFSRGGYEVVFIDIDRQITDELNRKGKYRIIIKSDKEEIIDISNVRGVCFDEREKVANEIAEAGIVAVSVGQEGLVQLFPLLANGLLERQKIDREYPLDIIIAENLRNADIYFHDELVKLLPESYPFEKLVGLIETSIGKMVPIMHKKDTKDDILLIFAEPYNTLILNKKGFKNTIPAISGLAPKENMKAWVDRKLFIHNLGHSAAAYLGYLNNSEYEFMHEALAVPEVFDRVRKTMLQSADILLAKYPGEFSTEDLNSHIDDLLDRFQNKALGDTIYRVGCDLMRKLGPYDRLAGAIREAIVFNLKYDKILNALVCGCHFRAKDEDGISIQGDLDFVKIYNKGISSVLTTVCGFTESQNASLFREADELERILNN